MRVSAVNSSSRAFSNTTPTASSKVAVLGAAGGIGQPLSLLLKLSNYVDELACYDIVGTPGIAADLSHVSLVRKRIFQNCLEATEFSFV